MKRKLLILSVLVAVLSADAQIVSYVGNTSKVYVKKEALVYSGGGVKVVGDGLVDNSGNVMVVGDANSKFATVDTNGAPKTNGGNFILRMTSDDVSTSQGAKALRYGQLYINGLTQANITGIVDKQYKDVAHGTYQQIALPFYGKNISELSAELGKTFDDARWDGNAVLVWNNRAARFDQLKMNQKTSDAYVQGERNDKVAYYALGSTNFKADAAVKTIKGVPYANGISETLKDAAKGIEFRGGKAENTYREAYDTYLQDWFSASSDGAWQGNYGRNLYQFGNPYFTNLDIAHLKSVFANIQGVEVEPTNVITDDKAAWSLNAQYITYESGVPTGDNRAIIRPMQTFIIKLKDNNSPATLNFDKWRRFAYTPRAEATPNKVTAARSARSSASSSVKQLAVIAQNEKGEEIGRTYYVVYANAITGQPTQVTTQVTASNQNIGTFEEKIEGGIDENLMYSYWLYINEANEVNYKGKKIPLSLYNKDIKSLKFEIQENAQFIKDGQTVLTSGESFYINTGDRPIALANGAVMPIKSADASHFGLYYGLPETTLAVANDKIEKPSNTFVVYDSSVNHYKLVFDATWKTAKVQVFDMSGKLLSSSDNVNTSNNYVVELPSGNKGTYVVTAVSETGKKFTQKIVK